MTLEPEGLDRGRQCSSDVSFSCDQAGTAPPIVTFEDRVVLQVNEVASVEILDDEPPPRASSWETGEPAITRGMKF